MNIKHFMEGKKTYTALIVAILGVLGAGDLISEGEVSQIIDLVLQLAGIAGAVYGRYVAKPKK